MAARTDALRRQELSLFGWNRSGFKEITLKAASYLTDPVCMTREFWMRYRIMYAIYPEAYRVTNLFRKGLCMGGIGTCTILAVVCTVFGMGLRYAVCRFQQDPFIYRKGIPEIPFQGPQVTIFSWNICYPKAGYEISDGGVLSSPQRIAAISREILEQNADVVCLYEVFDIKDAGILYEKMKNQYAHFYFNMGIRVIGLSSGIFVATKYEVENPEFFPFPIDALDGRAKRSGKGIFSLTIKNCARVFATHLQHSEISSQPTSGEQLARQKEMDLMMNLAQKAAAVKARIVVGDLNLGRQEFEKASWKDSFIEGDAQIESTWGGDAYCAALEGKQASSPMQLDYNMILKGTAQTISTRLIETGFDGKVFNPAALSDHQGLLSTVTL